MNLRTCDTNNGGSSVPMIREQTPTHSRQTQPRRPVHLFALAGAPLPYINNLTYSPVCFLISFPWPALGQAKSERFGNLRHTRAQHISLPCHYTGSKITRKKKKSKGTGDTTRTHTHHTKSCVPRTPCATQSLPSACAKSAVAARAKRSSTSHAAPASATAPSTA